MFDVNKIKYSKNNGDLSLILLNILKKSRLITKKFNRRILKLAADTCMYYNFLDTIPYFLNIDEH